MAKGGGSANKSFLFQETKAILNPKRMLSFLDEKIRSLGTAACPPYHLAVVIGGTSAEFALKTAKYASAHYLDNLPTAGSSMSAHGFRDLELEEEVFKLTQSFGIGAQFGGKYFCHDVRVVRLPATARPARWRSRCPARPTARRSARSRPRASSSSSSETDPAHYMPDAGVAEDIAGGEVVPIDLTRPMEEILAELSQVPGEDPALADRSAGRRARHRARQDQGAARRRRGDAAVPEGPPRVLRRPRQDPRGPGVRLVRAHHRRPHGLLRRAVPGRRRLDGDARQGQPLEASSPRPATPTAASTSARSAGRRARLAQDCIKSQEVIEYPELGMEAVWKIEVEDFPAFIVVDHQGNDFFTDPSGTVTVPVTGLRVRSAQ